MLSVLSCRQKSFVFFRNSFIATLMTISASTGYAATVTPMVNSTVWQFKVTPYIWAMNMNGTVQAGSRRAHVDENFSDLASHMNFGGMIFLEAYKDKFGLFANGLFAVLADGGHFYDGLLSVDAKLRFGIFSAGASYEVYKYCFAYSCSGETSTLTIEPYLGARYTSNHVRLSATALGVSLTNHNNQEWTDPIVGVRLNYLINQSWSAMLAGDIGGTNTSNHYSYNAWGLIGYTPQNVMKFTTTYLGYRVLDQHYVNGSGANYFNWNMKLFGPVIGVTFKF